MLKNEQDFTDTELDYLHQPSTEEDMRRLSKERLIQINRERKALDDKARQILISLSDSEQRDKLYKTVLRMHELILEYDKELHELLGEGLLSVDEIKVYQDSKHDKFFRSAEVFEQFTKHPVQKDMVKTKCINKRKIKKSKTPNQHMECMMSSKKMYNLEKRVQVIETVVSSLQTKVEYQDTKLAVYGDLIDKLVKKQIHSDKIAMYNVKLQKPQLTQTELAEMFGVSDRTIRNWLREVQGILMS